MEDPRTRPDAGPGDRRLDEMGALRALLNAVKSRIFGGLLLALPIVITIWIIYWLYSTLQGLVLDPLAHLVSVYVFGTRSREGLLPFWWNRIVAPGIAIGLVLVFLYFLGHLVRTRLALAIDWVLLRVPVVTIVYKAVRNVFQALEDGGQGERFKRVVLVEFPHPGVRSLAFVTKSLRDVDTDRTILCVCVLTGVMPPAGFTLFVPEEDVIDVDWTANQTLQVILSGGITAPSAIPYFRGDRTPMATGPIIDPHGKPIAAPGPREGEPVEP